MKQILKLVFLLSLLMILINVVATGSTKNNIGKWYLAKESDSISLFYRWINQNSGKKAREMKAEFTINAGVPKILEQFFSARNYQKWAVGIKECEIEKKNDSLWYAHSLMDYPWPLRKKDLITKHFVRHHSNNVVLYIEAAPLFKPQTKGIERMKNFQGIWAFFPNPNGTTRVEYRVVSFQKPVFPRFVQDPVIQKITIDSFTELKILAEAR